MSDVLLQVLIPKEVLRCKLSFQELHLYHRQNLILK